MGQGILIVGASLGGLRLAEQVRAAGYAGLISIVGAERHLPYNRPPLSKDALLAAPELAAVADAAIAIPGISFALRPSVADVSWHLGAPAAKADLSQRTVTLADGRVFGYEALGIATGLTPRRLAQKGGKSDRYVLRTIDDAVRLGRALRLGGSVVVVGGGFIGCEVAATARKCGCEVTVIETLPQPMCRAIGFDLAQAMRTYHEAHGVRFCLGVSVDTINHRPGLPDRLASITLSNGARVNADVLIEAVGSVCNVDWLAGNELDVTDGILTDNAMRVSGHPEVVAVGDIARFPNPRYDCDARRVEHWAIPALTARRAAVTLAASLSGRTIDVGRFDPLPTFWSDQFDLRLQSIGMPALGDRSGVLEGDLANLGRAGAPGIAMGYWRNDQLIGVITVGLPAARMSEFRAQLN